MLRSKAQTFNDGIVSIYSVTNMAAPGEKALAALTLKQTLRYKERTVGVSRFYAAMQENVKVAYLLRCPLLREISTQDIAVPNDGKEYRIVQIQYPEDVQPPVMDLTLEGVKTVYDIN